MDRNRNPVVDVDGLTPYAVLEEKGVQLRLSLVDTPGFGDLIDNSKQYVGRGGGVERDRGPQWGRGRL